MCSKFDVNTCVYKISMNNDFLHISIAVSGHNHCDNFGNLLYVLLSMWISTSNIGSKLEEQQFIRFFKSIPSNCSEEKMYASTVWSRRFNRRLLNTICIHYGDEFVIIDVKLIEITPQHIPLNSLKLNWFP